MPNIICAQCGATFTSADQYRRHYAASHPDEPFPELWDSPDLDEEFRSWGGTEPTASDEPVNIFEDLMEEPPDEAEG